MRFPGNTWTSKYPFLASNCYRALLARREVDYHSISYKIVSDGGTVRTIIRLLHYVAIIFLLLSSALAAQAPKQEPSSQKQEPSLRDGLTKRKLSKREQDRREKAMRKEMENHYKKWLEEDVIYILTPEEKEVFDDLGTEEEREQFIEQFWFRRDPTPGTIENEYKEEHYRRIAYVNERYNVGRPGWLSDRGRIYIMHGQPDEITAHPTGDLVTEDQRYGGRRTSVSRAFEVWRYNYVAGVGQQIEIEFVDRNGDGDYKLTLDPTEKEVFTSAGPLTRLYEPQLLTDSGDATSNPFASRQFDMMENMNQMMAMSRPPVKFKELAEMVSTRISFNLLPYEVRTDYFRITSTSILVPITVAIKKEDLQFNLEQGIHQAEINIFGQITSLTGRIISTFEDVIQISTPDTIFQQTLKQKAIYQKAVPLRSGLYKLNLVLKDLNSGNLGTLEQRLVVPRFEEGDLALSSLVLADSLERSATRQVGGGQFVIGETKVRPSMGEKFRQSQRMGIYFQVYNLAIVTGSCYRQYHFEQPGSRRPYPRVHAKRHQQQARIQAQFGQRSPSPPA